MATDPITTPTKGFSLKNFKWENKYFLYAGAAVLGTYIVAHLVKQSNLLNKTCFTPAGFVPNTLSLTDADINIKLKMKNKSNINYYIKNQLYNAFIDNQFIGVIKNPNELHIAPDRTTDVWLNVRVNPMKVAPT